MTFNPFWEEKDWEEIGRATLAELPWDEQLPFIKWLTGNPRMLYVYEKSAGEALRLWCESAECHQLADMRLPEGF